MPLFLLPNISRVPGEHQCAEVLGPPEAKLRQGWEQAFLLNKESKPTTKNRSTRKRVSTEGGAKPGLETLFLVACS